MYTDKIRDDWSSIVEWKRSQWFNDLDVELLPHDMSDAKGMQLLQCPYYIFYEVEEKEEAAFAFDESMLQPGQLRMCVNHWFACKDRDPIKTQAGKDSSKMVYDKEKMMPFKDPWASNAYVACNRDLAITFLMIRDYLTPKYGNQTKDGTPWKDRHYIQPMRDILWVKLHFLCG